jgi:hypothetical protein
MVEQDILCQTVKRYRRNVALAQFIGINGALLDNHKDELTAIFERCCRYTDAHSNPDEVTDKPDLTGLSTDFETVKAIRSSFNE